LAQTAFEDSVQLRPRPDFDAEGLFAEDLADGLARSTGFIRRDLSRGDVPSNVIFFPRLQQGLYYDDNLLRTEDNRRSDFALTTLAAVDIVSDHEDHGVRLGGSVERDSYLRLARQDYTEFGGHVAAYSAPTDETKFALEASQDHKRQPIEDSGLGATQLRATFYDLTNVRLSGEYLNADWQLAPSGSLNRYAFEANPPVVFGNEFDRCEWNSAFRLGYSFSEGSGLFVEPQINVRHYNAAIGLDGFRHDSSGYQILAGTRFDVSSVSFLEFGAGWLEQYYADQAFPLTRGPAFRAKLVWNPRDRLSFALESGRRIDEANLPGVAGMETTFAAGSLDYELDDNWLADINLAYADSNFQANGLFFSREDETILYGIGIRYLVNQRVSIGGTWSAYDRNSNAVGQDLRFNRYLMTISLQW
jgi:hypothetical protein